MSADQGKNPDPARPELIARAARQFHRHFRKFEPSADPPAIDTVRSEVDRQGTITLRDAAGNYLWCCRWTGKRVEAIRRCQDCGTTSPGWYMLRRRIWDEEAGYGPAEVACIPCLEKRLGRPLRSRDFTPPRGERLGLGLAESLRSGASASGPDNRRPG
jgi:hypothetical protein